LEEVEMTTNNQEPPWTSRAITIVTTLLLVQFAVAYVIGTGHFLTNDQQSMFPPIAITVALPVSAFLIAYLVSGRFRDFILAQDIETLTMLQHWRVLGFGFLTLYFYDVLPGLFAWPAGLGDVLVGLMAPFVVLRLRNDANFATSAAFSRFHYLGLLDFAVAVVTVGLAAGSFPALIPNGVTGAPMDVWPLNLFPSFGVPIFIILHLTVLFQVRELRRTSQRLMNTTVVAA
jgi:hypothetical protein